MDPLKKEIRKISKKLDKVNIEKNWDRIFYL